MRFPGLLFVFLAVAAFRSALTASLESAEEEEGAARHDGLTELQKIDQMEFEAAQKREAAQKNVTEEHNEDALGAVQGGSAEERTGSDDCDSTAQGTVKSRAREESGSSEEADEHHKAKAETVSSVGEVSQDSTKEKGVLE